MLKMKKKVSFDFDSTLDRVDVQILATQLVKDGHEVWIVTSRPDVFHNLKVENLDLFEVAKQCGILKENIHFTCYGDKIEFIEGKGFDFHLDDDDYELVGIMKSKDDCKPINVDHFSWKEHCLEVIK